MYKSKVKNVFVILLTSLFLLGCIEKEAPKVNWRLQSQATENSLDFKELKEFSANVAAMSAGRLTIDVYPSGEVTSGPDIFSAVEERRIEMGNGWPNWWSGKNPAWALMNAGPFDFMNIDASMMFFLAEDGTELANQLSRPLGVMWRPAWWPGMEFGLLSKEPIKGLNDLDTKRVRIGPGLPSEVLAAASNAYTIPLLPQEIRSALENNDIDAVEWTTAAGAWDLGLADISKHAIVPAIWQPSVLADFLINEAAYNELPDDLKAILESAIKSYTLSTTFKAKVADFAAMKNFSRSGVTFNRWSEEDIAKWKEVTEVVMEDYAKKSKLSKTIIEKKKAFKEEYNQYYRWFGSYE